jgi:methionyl-tRNA synthetase
MSQYRKRYYITTPIYYVNGTPHIGTATTTLLADATARYRKLRGDNTLFLTGTDENARKVLEAAEKAGKDPHAFVDEVSQRFVDTWRFMGIEQDVFFRTTESRHARAVQEVFRRLQESGDVYLGTYEGWYSVNDETFFRDTDVDPVTRTAKETGAKVERVTEESYFFRLSRYGDALKAHILSNPDFLIPDTRRNEVLSFIDQGLRDIAITQNRVGWGIPVPGETGKVIYVWFDALINYLTATGWPDEGWENIWPADAHLMAKEIFTRFHATLWPAMLMALNLPLPRHVVGHGWWVVGGEKGSKSKGNIPSCEEVVAYLQEQSGATREICVDALRYYLIRDIRFTDDAEYSREMLVTRFNADLANDLGNVLNRVLRAKYFEGVIPTPRALDPELSAFAASAVSGYESALERFDWGSALQSVWTLVSAVNKYLDEKAPWALAKNGDAAGVADVVYNALEGTRLAAYLNSPVMPYAAGQIASQLGLAEIAGFDSWETASKFGALPSGLTIGEPTPLFPRIDTKKAFPVAQVSVKTIEKETRKMSAETKTDTAQTPESSLISIDDFARIEFRVADIVSAERIEGAKKLLLLEVKVGEEERQIVSGIADAYAPEDLIGKQIVVVANLQPATIRGVSSQGMLLAATDAEGRAVLLHPDKAVASGSKVR